MDFDKPKVYGDTFISDGLVLLGAIFLCYLGNSLVGQLTSCLQAVERMGSEQSLTWSTSLKTGIDRAAKIASNWIV